MVQDHLATFGRSLAHQRRSNACGTTRYENAFSCQPIHSVATNRGFLCFHPPEQSTFTPRNGPSVVQPWQDALSPEVAARLERARAGGDEAHHLEIGAMKAGVVGVLDAKLAQLQPVRTFTRKNGTEGRIGRATLSQHGADVELVLWDHEIEAVCDAVQVGQDVRLAGVAVKQGYRGGLELSLGAASVIALQGGNSGTDSLEGMFALEQAAVQDDGTIRAVLHVDTADGRQSIVLAGEPVRHARGLERGIVTDVSRHPVMDDWWLSTAATSVRATRQTIK